MSVLFILMRDERQSTQPNAAAADQEGMADRLPKVLASRLRTARNALGLSQGAVAKAMSDRGFSWRQTTVAKSEAADRPVLFAEVAALAQIYRRPIDYFIYPGSDLENLVDQAMGELRSIRHAIAETNAHIRALKEDARLQECAAGLGLLFVQYRNTADSGPLLAGLQGHLSRYGHLTLEMDDIYEAIDITENQLSEIDDIALREIALVELARFATLSVYELQDESGELLKELTNLVEGKNVPDDLVSTLWQDPAWPTLISVPLTDLVMEALDRQSGRRFHLNTTAS